MEVESKGIATVEVLAPKVQLPSSEPMSEVTVELSEIKWKVLLEVGDVNVASTKAPPGRDELRESPYYQSAEVKLD